MVHADLTAHADSCTQHTLVDLLRWEAARQADHHTYTYLADGEQQSISISCRDMEQCARSIGAALQRAIEHPGQPVLLLYPPGLEFVTAFYGCLFGGMIAVPAYPPHPQRPTRAVSRIRAILKNAAPAAVLTTSSLQSAVQQVLPQAAELPPVIVTDALHESAAGGQGQLGCDDWVAPSLSADSLAVIQYTSGSTGAPKGVMLSHGNLLNNSAQIKRNYGHDGASHGVIWLPPYHDMGLIGGIIQPLYLGCTVTLMSPIHFLQQPIRWLEAITRSGATTSGGPNFAYELCVEHITPAERGKLDLSTWEVAFVGAEPVHAETLDRFAAAFEPCGFRRESFYPCYGLAEATLIVSGGCKSIAPVVLDVDALPETPQSFGVANPGRASTRIVGCGRSVGGHEIMIVDPDSLRGCPAGSVGEIWVRGPGVAQGYWQLEQESEQTFGAYLADTAEGPFLRTGDLGFLQDGELFVTGRIKDLIILDGRNHYPQDLEKTVQACHPAVRGGCCAAFSVSYQREERLVIVAEIERSYWRRHVGAGATTRRNALTDRPAKNGRSRSELDEITSAIRRSVAEHHDAQVADIVFIKPASLAKTLSGKIQRNECRARYLADGLEAVTSRGETRRPTATHESCDVNG